MSALDTISAVEPLLFSPFGSLVEVTVTSFVKVTPVAVPLGMCPVKVNVAVAPAGIGLSAQVVVVLGTPQLNVGPLIWLKETNVICAPPGTPAGRVSVNETMFAALGPALVTVMM